MKILSLRSIHGPNVYHQLPVLVMRLALLQWTNVASNEIPGFNERLGNLFPGMLQHTCSLGYAGGFFERLQKGTYAAHIIEHIALELSQLAGIEVTYGKSRYAGQEGIYDVITRFTNEEGMRECLRSAVDVMRCVLENKDCDVAATVENIKRIVERSRLGISTEAIVSAAQRRDIPVRRIGQESLFQLGYGSKQKRIQSAITDNTSLIASDIAQDKSLTKEILHDAYVPVPRGVVIRDEEELEDIVSSWPGPYALKPLDGHHGEGVSLNLRTLEELKNALNYARKYSGQFIVEEMRHGKDYRILVINGQFAAAAERIPPTIVGDGVSTIAEAIKKLNEDPLRGEGHDSYLSQVVIDDILVDYLKQQELTLESVPAAGQAVRLRGNANLSSGGTAQDVLKQVHPEVRILCERIARLIGLDICGIDIVAEDISKPVDPEKFSVIEVNTGPGLRMHLLEKSGDEDVGDKIVKMLYPTNDSRIPVISVTGTNGKTTVVRLISKIIATQGKHRVGMTSTEGVWIGDERILPGDCSGPASAELLLGDPAVDCAVLELARGGLLRGGLAYDWSDVGVITNIRADHIGQDGIENVDDLIWIKSLVAERVKENGVIVLNADDENCVDIKERPRVQRLPRSIYFYSTNPNNPALVSHISQGGTGLWLEHGWLVLAHKGDVQTLIPASDIPITMSGKATFQVSNVLASIGAALGAGVELRHILRALKEFEPSTANPGRMNIYKVGRGHVILDYGHNEDAIINVGRFLQQWRNVSKTLVIGLPGDRSTELILSTGRMIPQYFDRAVLRDDSDLRGRKPNEVPELLSTVFAERNFPCQTILKEEEAVHFTLSRLKPDEVAVVLFEDLQAVLRGLREFDPVPVQDLPFPPQEPAAPEPFTRELR